MDVELRWRSHHGALLGHPQQQQPANKRPVRAGERSCRYNRTDDESLHCRHSHNCNRDWSLGLDVRRQQWRNEFFVQRAAAISPTAVRNAEDRSCAPCHARGKVETNDVVFRRNLACTPAGICSTSTGRPVRLNNGFSISAEIGYC
jgi:hypothetical protein